MTNTNWYVNVLDAYYEVLSFEEANNVSNYSSYDAISLEKVSYQYIQSSTMALSKINLSFAVNDKIAIVGANGSGKSTCILIILEMLQKYTGIFSKKDIKCIAVLQNFMRYQMTIKENIEIGAGGAQLPDEKIISIPFNDPNYNHYSNIDQLPHHIFEEMRHFFQVYKNLENKTTAVKEVSAREDAVKIVS